MGKFIIRPGNDVQFYFNLKADNRQVILTSEGYTTIAARQNGIDSVKKNSTDDGRYEKLTTSNGKVYFIMKDGMGQVIGKRQQYESKVCRDKGIASLISNAPDASVTEE